MVTYSKKDKISEGFYQKMLAEYEADLIRLERQLRTSIFVSYILIIVLLGLLLTR